MYYTGIDPFTKQEVDIARDPRDRKPQLALPPSFRPVKEFRPRSHAVADPDLGWRRRPRRVLAEQLRGELVQVLLPVDPGVAAGRLLERRLVAELLEQGDRVLRPTQEEVLLAGGEPEEF